MSQDDGTGTAGPLDGNVAAGLLTTVFAVDVTTAVARCAGCGLTGPVGGARAYVGGPGVVVRCPGCDAVLIRVVEADGRAWLDLRGLAYLQVAVD